MPARPTRAARPMLAATLTLATILVCGACASGSASAPSATAMGSTAPSTAPAASPSPAPSAAPSATPMVLASRFYPYTWQLPPEAGLISPTLATVAWDGSAVIDSDGETVDRVYLPGSRLVFAFAAPTDDPLGPYADYIHGRAVQDHVCPDATDFERTTTLDGSPAVVDGSPCQNVYKLELVTVRDGVGLVIKQLAPPPDDPEALADEFEALLAGFRWDD